MASSPTVGRGRRLSFVALGLLLALGVGLLWWALAHQVGEPPAPASARQTAGATASAAPEDPATATSAPTPRPSPDALPDTTLPGASGSAGEAVAPGSERTAPQTDDLSPTTPALPASEPVRVRIPAIDVASELHPLGLDEQGRLEVPSGERYDEAAWYSGSPTPGESGPSVIEGHVTSQGSIPSVFFELGALQPGDTIEVDREDGTTATFEVYGADSFPKDEFPKTTVYGNTSGPELRLITCGGSYDPELGAHVDNIVVFARLSA